MLGVLFLTVFLAIGDSRTTGPYATQTATFTYTELDKTNQGIDVVYPVPTSGQQQVFPLIAYAHGFDDTGEKNYHNLFHDMASWGYVVAVALSCKFGCTHDCVNLKFDPPCFGHYYHEQLKVIDWSHTDAASKLPINHTYGVGVAGHSMGGQATLFSSAYNWSSHDIRASAMHHAFTHTFPAIADIPFIAFTGTLDLTAPPSMAEGIFNTDGAFSARGLVNKKGADHHEPTTHYNPQLALFTAAWFKIHLDKTPQSLGMDFDALIYGKDANSLCGGGDGGMKECTMLRRSLSL